jgi:hypothetical protein
MNPKPLSSLNHLTVPVSHYFPPALIRAAYAEIAEQRVRALTLSCRANARTDTSTVAAAMLESQEHRSPGTAGSLAACWSGRVCAVRAAVERTARARGVASASATAEGMYETDRQADCVRDPSTTPGAWGICVSRIDTRASSSCATPCRRVLYHELIDAGLRSREFGIEGRRRSWPGRTSATG